MQRTRGRRCEATDLAVSCVRQPITVELTLLDFVERLAVDTLRCGRTRFEAT